MDYVTFNLIEGLFWIVLGLTSFILSYKVIPRKFKPLSLFAGSTLVLFGISDLVESQVGSFFVPGLEWLFIWKVLGVGGLIYSLMWYLWLRLR